MVGKGKRIKRYFAPKTPQKPIEALTQAPPEPWRRKKVPAGQPHGRHCVCEEVAS